MKFSISNHPICKHIRCLSSDEKELEEFPH